MTGNTPYNNPASQRERREVLRNEREASTYHQFAHADDSGGRFKNQTTRITVGSKPLVEYPAGPNWSADPTGVEPPLGVAIDEMEPVGTATEIEMSLREMRDGVDSPFASSPDSPSGDGSALPRGHSSPRSRAAAPSPLLKRRRV